MTTKRIPIAISIVCQALCAQSESDLRPPLEAELPTAGRQSSWRQELTRSNAEARRGLFPIGNGSVFAHLGLGARANTLAGMTGPRYANEPVGSLSLELRADGRTVELPVQRVRRVRGESTVITEDAGSDFVLTTRTFAPPERSEILRVVEVTRRGGGDAVPVTLVARCDGARADGGSLAIRRGTAAAVITMTGGEARGAELLADLGRLAPGDPWRGVVRIAFGEGDQTVSREPVALADAVEAAREHRQHWRARLQRGTHYDTDHEKLRDLIEGWRVDVEALRCAESGLIAPLVDRRTVSVRDNNGILLMLLRFGLWEEAAGILRYFERATRLLGRVPEEVPLDLDFGALDGRESDWRTVDVPAAEVPSWIILQHYWYWRATRDTALIDAHWGLLDVCLKRQVRGEDDLLPFEGGESYLGGALYRLPWERFGEAPLLVANDPPGGRRAWSLGSNTLFLLATQAIGDLVEARQAFRGGGGSDAAAPYRRRMFALMQSLEKRYWIDDAGLFAPALSPVDGRPHTAPVANANLMPLWAGWTFPTGERSRDNLATTLAGLWRDGARIGTTARVGHATGDLQGMLLVALSERDGRRRLDVLDSLLELAEPAGAWAALYDPDGRPLGASGETGRLRPGVSGINLDAILFAITGIRQACVPAWDMRDIRLELRLPRGARWFAVDGHAKDGRELALRLEREMHLMSADEIEAQAEKPPEEQRDPNVEHAQLHFVVELLDGEHEQGYWDVAARGGSTMFVRYLSLEPQPDGRDLSRIEERDYIDEDEGAFLPDGDAPPTVPSLSIPQAPESRDGTLLLTSRRRAAEMLGDTGVTVLDTGLPFTVDDLVGLLLDDDGTPQHARIVLDWEFDARPPKTFTPRALWEGDTWRDALARFDRAGGAVVRPRFLSRTNAGAATAFDAGTRVLRFPFEATADIERAVLRIGCDRGLAVRVDGHEVGTHRAGLAVPDQTSLLVALEAGAHVVECELAEPGPGRIFVRWTDARGLPLEAVR